MSPGIQKVVILGGGTAGWMTAALLSKVLGEQIAIELVESDEIGIIGVGEATIPPIQIVNSVLDIEEADFLRETKATIKLAIRFENWSAIGESYYRTFWTAARNQAFSAFHHVWTRTRKLGIAGKYWDNERNYLCAEAGKFAQAGGNDSIWDMPYAYHFDSGLYGQFLRRYAEARGFVRTEGMVAERLTGKIALFRKRHAGAGPVGHFPRVLMGACADGTGRAAGSSVAELRAQLPQLAEVKSLPLAQLPSNDAYLQRVVAGAP